MLGGIAKAATGVNWLKVAKFAVPAIALLVAVLWLRGVLNERAVLRAWQADTVAAVSAEMPDGKSSAKTAVRDIQWLGRERRTNTEALRIQSERLVAAAGKATAAQNDAQEARKQAAQRNKDREGTRRAILTPGRSTGLTEAEWGKL